MGRRQVSNIFTKRHCHRRYASASVLGSVCAGILLSAIVAVSAQEQKNQNPPAVPNSDHGGFFSQVGRWFDQQFARFHTDIKDTKVQIDNFGQQADAAAKSAIDTLVRIPQTKVIRIHITCEPAPNGAPDCESVAMRVCKANGYRSGKSIDMTTAEKCPARVWVSGRAPAPGECKNVTFVSSVLCN